MASMLAYPEGAAVVGRDPAPHVQGVVQRQLPRHGRAARVLLLLRAVPGAAVPHRARQLLPARDADRRHVRDARRHSRRRKRCRSSPIRSARSPKGEQGGLLTLGMLLALWSSSAAMTSIIDTLNTAYDIEEGRPWWKVRLTAIGLTVGVALFILVSFALILVGPTAGAVDRRSDVARQRVRVDLDDPAVAARLRAREHRRSASSTTSRRTRSRTGCG